MSVGLTIKQVDVARACGVSRTAVAYAFHPRLRSQIKPETQQRILETARKLGYRPHRLAQVMRKGKSGIIGVLQFSGLLQVHVQRAYHLARLIHKSGYRMLASDSLWYPDGTEGAWTALLDAKIEGLILSSAAAFLSDAVVAQIRTFNIPTVCVSGKRLPGIPQVRADMRQGMYDLTQHLLALGHRRLVMLTFWGGGSHDERVAWPTLERVEGFQEAVRQHQLAHGGTDPATTEIVYDDSAVDWAAPYETGLVAMRKVLQRSARPDAVVCGNDQLAHGALAACAEAGVRVPEDLALTGFDDEPMSRYGCVPLTSVAQPVEEMSKRALDLLLKQMRGEPISVGEELMKLPCRLVVRQSCGARLRRFGLDQTVNGGNASDRGGKDRE